MSENISVKPLKCPNCKQELEMIMGEDVHAVYDLKFSQKRGTYIPYQGVMTAERFVCSLCNKKLPDSLFEKLISKNLVAVKLSNLKKTFLIEAQAQY
jgi:C4-type Zn-finger protein